MLIDTTYPNLNTPSGQFQRQDMRHWVTIELDGNKELGMPFKITKRIHGKAQTIKHENSLDRAIVARNVLMASLEAFVKEEA